MTRRKIAKSKRSEAERATEHYFYNVFNIEIFQIRRAVRTKWQAVDFWGCDVMGRDHVGCCYYAQVTTGQTQAVRIRRRKLEKIYWNSFDTVMVLQMVEQPDPANNRKKQFYFRIHEYDYLNKTWNVKSEAFPIPKAWFQKLRENG